MNTKVPFWVLGALLLSVSPNTSSAQSGSVDLSFDPGTGANAFVESAVLQPDGKLLLCGMFTEIDGVPCRYVARLNADGSIDRSFNARPSYWVRYMSLQPDGKIVIGGFFTAVEDVRRNRIARLNADGSLDLSFDPGAGCEGKIVPVDPTDPFIFAMGLQSDGKIVIGGNFTNYNGVARCGVARVNPNGSLDTTFDVGNGVNSWVRTIHMLPNDQIMLGGWFTSYNRYSSERMVRVNADGSPDTTFRSRFGERTAVYTIARQLDGKFIAAGHSVSNDTPFFQEIVRLNVDGSYDPTFNVGGEGADEKVQSVVLQPDGKIIMAGYFSRYNGVQRKTVARLNTDGSLDTSFVANGDNWAWTALRQEDGRIVVCGDFRSINGTPRKGVARLNTAEIKPFRASPAVGSMTAWFMDGTNLVDSVSLRNGAGIGAAWRLAGTGDFNLDGSNDLIWQHTDGRTAMWFMDGTRMLSSMGWRRAGWKLSGTGDLNGDTRADLFWRDSTNRTAVWFMRGTNVLSSLFLRNGRPMDPKWQLAGVRDFDGDDKMDILWQHTDGRATVWLMNGAVVRQAVALRGGQSAAANWRIVGVGSFSASSQNDILWQHSDGRLSVWLMNGTQFLSAVAIPGSEPPTAAWRVSGMIDFEKDAEPELLWRYLP
jgi:uncharacterized delta-60 repeat protein